MMFTKMMVIVDGDVDIHKPDEVARYVSRHFDPEHDTYFSTGPVDVLDHSCSVMAFGGKIGIDATAKTSEELSMRTPVSALESKPLDMDFIRQLYPEIKDINASLLHQEIGAVVISVAKNRPKHIEQLAENLFQLDSFAPVKLLLVVESRVDISDIGDAVWRFSNNVDPKRDARIIVSPHHPGRSHLVMDGTRKTKVLDGFQRDWPNILASTEETINQVDEKWHEYGLGNLIPSPSAKYRRQLYGERAVAE